MIEKTKLQIINHVCYRDIFNAPLLINDLIYWLSTESRNEDLILTCIDELIKEQLIVEKNGYLAVIGKEEIIDAQTKKNKETERILSQGKKGIQWLNRIPIIRYIGISGSLAANNPTKDISCKWDGSVDMDLFVICRKNTLWIFFLFERIYTNVKRFILNKHFYCFNFVTEETFLEIYNKNFYTATEIINLKTLSDSGIYTSFISNNQWYKMYYQNVPPLKDHIDQKQNNSFVYSLLAPINAIFFVLFCIGRAIKRFEIEPLMEISSEFNPRHKCNLQRISNPGGGYQNSIKARFDYLYKKNFEAYYSMQNIEALFPKNEWENDYVESSMEAEYAEMFSKYSMNE